MRGEFDLDAAIRAGVLDERTAIALRNFQAQHDGMPVASAEKFRLFGGYADLVSALGMALILGALTILAFEAELVLLIPVLAVITLSIAHKVDMRSGPALATVLMVSWLFNSILTVPALLETADLWSNYDSISNGLIFLVSGIVATAIYWRKFRFPPTLAAAITTVGLIVIEESTQLSRRTLGMDDINTLPAILALVMATGTLIAATWWDLTDIRRETERSQVAFWLHCSAGFLLTRSLFSLLTGKQVIDGDLILTGLSLGEMPWLLAMIAAAAVLSLLLDRRSLLTGVLLPTIGIFGQGDEAIVAGMIIAGAGMLFFNYGWIRMRIALMAILPTRLEAQLPRTSLVLQDSRPTRRLSPSGVGRE